MTEPYSRYCKYCSLKVICGAKEINCNLGNYPEGFDDGYEAAHEEIKQSQKEIRVDETKKTKEV